MTKKALLERPDERRGNNLYPARLDVTLGEHELRFDVPEGVWNPTPHGVLLGEALAGLDFHGEHVLELGTGCGLHAVVIARQGATRMMLTEIEESILDNARHNLAKHEVAIQIESQVADWTQVRGAPYDALVTNPPFCKSGKRYRRHFIDTLILNAHKLVRPGGRMVFVQSSMADLPRTLSLLEEHGMRARILAEQDGPFRDYYLDDPSFLVDAARVRGGYTVRDGLRYERLTALEATLPTA